MAGPGIEWMLNLDARTQGALAVIDALGKTTSAADRAGAAIDRALSKMDKLPKMMSGDAGWSKGLGRLQQLTKGAQLTDREFAAVKMRAAALGGELERMGDVGGQKVGGLWTEVLKGGLVLEGIKLGAEVAWEAVKKTGEVLWDAVKVAAGSERTGRVFANMLGAEQGKETLEYLGKFAELSEFTDDALKKMSASMLNVGIRGADFRNALGASADVAALDTGDKTAAFEAAINSFVQIQRRGKIDARVLGGLSLNPHDVETQISKDLGRSKDVVAKQLKEGTLAGLEALPSIFTVIESKTKQQLGGLGESMKDLFSARLDKLRDIPEELFKGIKNSQGFQDVSDTIARITGLFGPESETGQRIQAALIKTLDVVGEKIKNIDWEKVAGFVATVAESFKDWVEPLSKVAELLGYVLKGLTGLLALPTLGKDIGDWFARKLHPEIGQTGAAAQDLLDEMGAANERAWKEAGADVAFAEQTGYKEANDQHSPSRVWMRMGMDTVAGLAQGFDVASPMVQSAAAGVVSPPSVADMSGAVSPSSSFNAGGVTAYVTVNAGGTGSSADDIAREVANVVPTAIMQALEQFNAAQGLA